MSRDEVDNLQDAEDHIGCLEVALQNVLHHVAFIRDSYGGERRLDERLTEIESQCKQWLGDGRYCRSDCAAGECSDDCACQAHGDEPHPGWVPRRTLEAIRAEYECDGVDAPMPDDEWALIEHNTATGEHWVTTHFDADSAEKYAKAQEQQWTPVALVHLQTRERLLATCERTMTIRWNETATDTEAV